MAFAKEEIYLLPRDMRFPHCADAWLEGLKVRRALPVNRMRQAFMDTFDGKLRRKGLLLERQGSRLRLFSREDGSVLHETTLQARRKKLFARDFPDGAFRDALEDAIEIRALLPFGTGLRSIQPLVVMDGGREAGRLLLESVEPELREQGDNAIRWARLLFAEGESPVMSRVRERLGSAGLKADKRPAILMLIAHLDTAPNSQRKKKPVILEPDMPALEALGRILRPLLEVMKENEAGILAEIDSEFLHDFRVSIRRTRSALGQLKNVFSTAAADRFRRDFALVQRITGPTRDLDVWLQKERQYQAMVPSGLRSWVQSLFGEIAGERRMARRKMVKHIRRGAYRKIISSWDNFLSRPDEGRRAGWPIIRLAKKRILKACRRVLEHGRIVGEPPEDRKLHRLRIECKKLRYLLEFFRCLLPAEKVDELVTRLKKLQDYLGEMNDLAFEKERLSSRLEKVCEDDPDGKRTATLGMLIALMYRRHGQLNRSFKERFAVFACPDNLALYRRLFGPGGEKSGSGTSAKHPKSQA